MTMQQQEHLQYRRTRTQPRDYFEVINELMDNNKKYKLRTIVDGDGHHAVAAGNMKRILSVDFPEIKFIAKSSTYSGGSSSNAYARGFKPSVSSPPEITREYLDKLNNRIDEIRSLFSYGNFDGMTDSYDYKSDSLLGEFQSSYGSSKFVFVEISRDFYNTFYNNEVKRLHPEPTNSEPTVSLENKLGHTP